VFVVSGWSIIDTRISATEPTESVSLTRRKVKIVLLSRVSQKHLILTTRLDVSNESISPKDHAWELNPSKLTASKPVSA
jgi:hypothetical protein